MAKEQCRAAGIAAGAALLLVLAGCSQQQVRSVPSPDPGLQLLRTQLDALAHRADAAETEQQRLRGLLEQLAQQLAKGPPPGDGTALAQLRAALERLRDQDQAASQHSREALLALGQQLAQLQRTQEQAASRLDQVHLELTELAARAGPSGALQGPLEKIAEELRRIRGKDKQSLLDQLLPFLGVMLGGALALGSSWWLKREETMIKLSETYLSNEFQTKYAEARWLVDNPGSPQATAAARNKVLQVVGFFKFVKALKKRRRLDSSLLEESKILENGEEFFASIRGIDTTLHPPWNSVVAQLS